MEPDKSSELIGDKTDQIGNWLDGTNKSDQQSYQSDQQLVINMKTDDGWDQILGIYEQNRKEEKQRETKITKINNTKSEIIKNTKRIKDTKKIQLKDNKKNHILHKENSEEYDEYGEDYEYEDYFH